MSRLQDRLRGGWAGQMIGVSYGAPYEFRARGKTIDQPLRQWKPEFVWNSLRQEFKANHMVLVTC